MKTNNITKLIFTICFLSALTAHAQVSFEKGSQILGDVWGRCLASGDIDNDGDIDIIIGHWDVPFPDKDTNQIWLNKGDGTFELSGQFIGTYGRSVALDDFNGDNLPDIVFTYECYFDNTKDRPNSVWLNKGNGIFEESCILDMSEDNYIQTIDFIKDTYTDILIDGSVWINDGSGNFSKSGSKVSGENLTGCTLGDIDNDGDYDAIAKGSSVSGGAPCRVFFNDGAGNFVMDTNQAIGNSNTLKVLFGDLNGDNSLDVFIANYHLPGGDEPESDEIWFNDGKGVFNKGDFSTIKRHTNDAKLKDIDKDGDLDIYTAYEYNIDNPSSNITNYIWINDGKGNFTAIDIGVKSITQVAIDDFNGDNKPDVLALMDGGNTIWFNTTISGIPSNKLQNIKIYPNPAQNTLQIEYPDLSQKKAYYKIIDLSGKTVQVEKLTGNNIDISGITKGTYILNLEVDGECLNQKFIIE